MSRSGSDRIEREKFKRRKVDGQLYTICVEQKIGRMLTVRAADKEAAKRRAMEALNSQGLDVQAVFVGYGGSDERFGEGDHYDPGEDQFEYEITSIESEEDQDDFYEDEEEEEGEKGAEGAKGAEGEEGAEGAEGEDPADEAIPRGYLV